MYRFLVYFNFCCLLSWLTLALHGIVEGDLSLSSGVLLTIGAVLNGGAFVLALHVERQILAEEEVICETECEPPWH
jgi:hypothetical protein